MSRVRWHHASRSRGHRHLVRLGFDVVRAMALSLRESGDTPVAVPRRLHCRGRGPDARVVLLAPGDPTGLGPALPNIRIRESEARSQKGMRPSIPLHIAPSSSTISCRRRRLKMSKSRGNIVDPWDVIPRHGADAVRLFLVPRARYGSRASSMKRDSRARGAFLLTLKNVYSGIFAQYANFGWSRTESDPPWRTRRHRSVVLSRLKSVERRADTLLGAYDATLAARSVMDFLVDDVSNGTSGSTGRASTTSTPSDSCAAFATLHEVLVVTAGCWPRSRHCDRLDVSRAHRRYGARRPVHACRRGGPAGGARGPGSRARDDAAQDARHARTVRARGSGREGATAPGSDGVRRPAGSGGHPSGDVPLLAAELNVKAWSSPRLGMRWYARGQGDFRSLGKRFGKATPLAAQAVTALTSEAVAAFERGSRLRFQ